MSAVGDLLFGSKPEPGRIVDVTPDEYAGLRGPIAASIRNIINTGGGPSYTGPLAAGMSDQEKALLDRAIGQAMSGGAGDASRDFLTSLLRGGGENPFLADAIRAAQRPTLEAFQDVVMPRLKADFTRAGQFVQEGGSSPFDRAAALASRGLANSLADIATNISFGSFENERNRQLEAARVAPAVEAAELDRTVKGLQAAALPRLIEELGIERGIQEFTRRVQVLLEALRLGGSVSSPTAIPVAGTPGSTGLIGSFLQAVAGSGGESAGSSLANMLFA